MRFPIPLVVELDDEQLAKWAAATGVPCPSGGVPRAKDAVKAMREQVPDAVRDWFDHFGVKADVSVKR